MSNLSRLRRAALPLLIASAGPLWGQDVPPVPPTAPSDPDPQEIEFASDSLEYDSEAEIVTASGNVVMKREGNRVVADKVTWDRDTGKVFATGNVSVTNPGGDIAYGDSVELTDTLKDGVVENLLIVLADGGRLAAARGTRVNGITTLEKAVYSPCSVEDGDDCRPKRPSWQITAVRVIHDPVKKRISYKNARLELFGIPILLLPGFSHPSDDSGGTGFLIPNIQYTRNNGVEVATPFFLKIAPNRDLTVTPHFYSDVLPMVEAEYRALTDTGAYRVSGFGTYSRRISNTVAGARESEFRGYFDAAGKFQLTPRWSIKGSARVVTDRTFLRRYDISRDDRLRSTIEAERITRTSYFSAVGWGFQTLRANDRQGQVPFVLPMLDYRKRLDQAVLGGKAEFQINTLALGRTDGQDTQRGFASARWDARRITSLGQELLFTGMVRADVYHTDESALTTTALYRGRDGFRGRGIAVAAAEARWPFIGPAFGGNQRITPRFQLAASPDTRNLSLPNEDSRSVDLEDSNLFSLNRFPGYDRWEDGVRVTYGLDYQLDLPDFLLSANIGQSYRLSRKPALFPDGTGLNGRNSDVVGRSTIKYKRLLSLTHRFRLDKDNFAIRRNEIDLTFGTDRTYLTAGYLRLNRDVDPAIEDLRDREEIRLGGRLQFARYWSLFGSAIVDLTDRREDPVSLADGYEPIRHRLGVAYEDDCLRFGLTWRRDYDPSGDARRGNTYQIRLSFKNLGRF